MSPKKGRPYSDNPKNERLFIRVTSEEKAEIQKDAKELQMSLLELLKLGVRSAKDQQK